jgi:hypothetical protein
MIVGPITVRSACSHHFCPVIGKLWIGVMPNEHTNVIGLSKYARLAEWVMGRPQIQEEAVVQLADLIMRKVPARRPGHGDGGHHFCMAWRGVKDMDSKMINSVMRGVFLKDADAAPRIPLPHSPESLRLTMLVRLLYASRAVDATARCVEAILAQSRQHNPRLGITGILCYSGGIFLQAIEGGRMPVSELYGTSSATCATRTWRCCTTKKSSERRFGGWTMGQVCPSSTIPSCSSIQKSPSWTRTAVSGKVSLALLEELMATAAIIGRA